MKLIRIQQPKGESAPGLKSSRPTRGTQMSSEPKHSAAPPIAVSR